MQQNAPARQQARAARVCRIRGPQTTKFATSGQFGTKNWYGCNDVPASQQQHECYQSRLGDTTAWRPTGGAKTYLAEAMQSFPLALHITCLHGLAVGHGRNKWTFSKQGPYRQRRRRSSLMYPNLLHRMRICRQTPTCGGACISSVRFLPNMLSC